LESFSFDRGGVEQTSTCSIMMVGNISPDSEFVKESLFRDVLHEKLREEAFLTRLAGVVPGWELESVKMREVSITKNYGFMADYFSEILHELRDTDFMYILKERIELENANIRDEKSIFKMMSGLLKLVCPHSEIDDEILSVIADYAVELRQFVVDQLYQLTGKKDYLVKLQWKMREE